MPNFFLVLLIFWRIFITSRLVRYEYVGLMLEGQCNWFPILINITNLKAYSYVSILLWFQQRRNVTVHGIHALYQNTTYVFSNTYSGIAGNELHLLVRFLP